MKPLIHDKGQAENVTNASDNLLELIDSLVRLVEGRKKINDEYIRKMKAGETPIDMETVLAFEAAAEFYMARIKRLVGWNRRSNKTSRDLAIENFDWKQHTILVDDIQRLPQN